MKKERSFHENASAYYPIVYPCTKFPTNMSANGIKDFHIFLPHAVNSMSQTTSSNSITENGAQRSSSPNKRPFITLSNLPPPRRDLISASPITRNQKPLSASPQNAHCLENLPVDNKASVETPASDKSPTYNLLNLIDDWNKCELLYTQSWGYMLAPCIGVQFLYYLHLEPSNWHGILVRNDMTVEGMFGMIRSCCGSTDKPDPQLFILVYRLISFYALVKPPKGSNVSSLETFETLLANDHAEERENKERFESTIHTKHERKKKNIENWPNSSHPKKKDKLGMKKGMKRTAFKKMSKGKGKLSRKKE